MQDGSIEAATPSRGPMMRWALVSLLALTALGCPEAAAPSQAGGVVDIGGSPIGFSSDTAPADASAEAPDLPAPAELGPSADDSEDTPLDVPAPADPGSTDATPGCEPGPCNDGDACTINDQCVDGACAGVPVDCDDSIVCTLDSCQEGSCVHAIADGFCQVDGACYANGDKNPNNACQRCAEPTAKDAWSDVLGPCDDGDPCTEDLCDQGACVGTPLACPDDGNPCTVEQCVAGTCVTQSSAGVACEDGDPCTGPDLCDKGSCAPGPQKSCPDDGNPCTNAVCGASGCVQEPAPGPCDNGDPCTTADQCVAGVCTPGPVALVCADECDYHKDCAPLLCATWQSTGTRKCSAPCAGDSDCGAGLHCTKLPGSANVGFCQSPLPDGSGTGTPCADDTTCASGHCLGGLCVVTCLDEQHCGATMSCTIDDQTAQGRLLTACYPDQPTLMQPGEACSQDNNTFDGALCQTGHCDLMPNTAPWLCAIACTSDADCDGGQECNLVLYADLANPAALPFSATFSAPQHDAFMGCYSTLQAGTKAAGQPCAADAECAGNKCQVLSASNPTKYCTTFCSDNSECPAGFECGLAQLGLSSNWLTNPYFQTQGPSPLNTTYVRICRLP